VRIASGEIKARAAELGFQLCGVCPAEPPPHYQAYGRWLEKGYHGTMEYLQRHMLLKGDPRRLLPSARSVIAVGLNYNQPNDHQEGYPKIARYALGRDYHKVLRRKLRQLSEWLEREHPGAEHRACVDSAPIMERDFAQQAGLGWFGKNTMLINSRRGSWFFIGLLLTSLEIHADKPAVGGCGTCTRCIEACPTGAIVFEDGRWQLDARRCISYLTLEHHGPIPEELEKRLDGWLVGCDVCQEVCPFNQPRTHQPERAQETRESDFLSRRSFPALDDLARLEHAEWDRLTRGSAVRRVGFSRMKYLALRALESESHVPPPAKMG
jgi:epoxyqueuosine reductase